MDAGELFVGAYLEIVKGCDVVDYNVRTKKGGLEGLGELDVMGFRFDENGISTVYLCEVTTHLLGLNYGSYEKTIQKIIEKYERQMAYAEKYLRFFDRYKYMYWSPRVPKGKLTDELSKINQLEFIINENYTDKFNELRKIAGKQTRDTGNLFFRVLQIQEHLR